MLRGLSSCVAAALAAAGVGCTPAQYARQADRAAQSALASGQVAALGRPGTFDVTYRPLGTGKGRPAGAIRVGAKVIPVGQGECQVLAPAEALEVAFRNSRRFQTEKESLYSSSLALANARRVWGGGLLGGQLSGDTEFSRARKGDTTKSGTAELAPSLTRNFIHGTVLALATTINLATNFLGSAGTTVDSLLEANVTQPLLRGAWRSLAYEDQYRLERDFIFAVFEYERFTQTFAAEVMTEYYGVLRRRDQLENERKNIARLRETLALTKVLVRGGQVSRIQQDQAEQDLLNAETRYERNRQEYQNAVDEFKLTLGLPLAARIRLDYPHSLLALRPRDPKKLPPVPFGGDEDRAVEVAMTVRPDLLTERAKVRDAKRDVEIAADAFHPQLNLILGVSATGMERQRFAKVRFDRFTRTAGLAFSYDLDQTDNRDAYRNAMIALGKARRDLARFEDGVLLEVRRSYRSLLRARRAYELQYRGVQIATGRRKLAALQQKEGLASARDVLEAEEALRNAQNSLTEALVSYATTRLEFLAALGMVWVDERKRIHERGEPFQFDRIGRRYPYVWRRAGRAGGR